MHTVTVAQLYIDHVTCVHRSCDVCTYVDHVLPLSLGVFTPVQGVSTAGP